MIKEFHQTKHPMVFLNGEVTNLAKSSDDLMEDHKIRPVSNHKILTMHTVISVRIMSLLMW